MLLPPDLRLEPGGNFFCALLFADVVYLEAANVLLDEDLSMLVVRGHILP